MIKQLTNNVTALTLHSHGQTVDGGRRLMNGTGKNKQSDGMEGRQNETFMAICCYGDVRLFVKN